MGSGRINPAVLRWLASSLVIMLVIAQDIYPHNIYLEFAAGIIGILGIHEIPSQGETMTEQFPAQKTEQGEPEDVTRARELIAKYDAPEPESTPEPAPEAGPVAPELQNPVGQHGGALMGVSPWPVTVAADPQDLPAAPAGTLKLPGEVIRYLETHASVLESLTETIRELVARNS